MGGFDISDIFNAAFGGGMFKGNKEQKNSPNI
jgi:DnaJ-class molecular chaperone